MVEVQSTVEEEVQCGGVERGRGVRAPNCGSTAPDTGKVVMLQAKRTTPHHTAPYHTTPHHTVPHYTTPHHTTPHHTTLYHTTPHHTTPCNAAGRAAED